MENKSLKLLSEIVEYLPCMLFAKSVKKDFQYVFWNKQAEIITGISKSEALGKNDYDFFSVRDADFFRLKDLETFTIKDVVEIPEEMLLSPTLGERWLRTWKVPLYDDAGNPDILLGISLDITESKLMQKNIEMQKLELLNSSKLSALGEMAAGIAHEINNPLTIILTKATQIKRELHNPLPDNVFLIESADKIVTTSQRIAKIIKGMNSAVRDSENDEFRNCKIVEVVNETLSLCNERFRFNNVIISSHFSSDKDIQIRGNQSQMVQVLLNLLNNAFDAICGLPEKWIKISVDESNGMAELKIIDSGSEIPNKIKEKLFQPFFTTKDVGKGTGLGLSISRNIINQHKGEIFLDANSSHTTFVITLPISST